MSCVASYETLIELFDVAMLRIINEPVDRPADVRGLAPIALRNVPTIAPEIRFGPEDDAERWDGLS